MTVSQNSSTHNIADVSAPQNVIFHPHLFPTNPPTEPSAHDAPAPMVHGVPMLNPPPKINIILRSLSSGDLGTMYSVGIYDPMYLLYNDYALKVDASPWMLSLYFNGVWVHPNTLAGQLGLYPYCTIVVAGQAPFMNLNSNVKVFSMEEIRTVGVRQQFKLHKNTSILQLVYMCAQLINVGPDRIILLKDQEFVYPHDSIMSAGIKNGDRVFAFVRPIYFP